MSQDPQPATPVAQPGSPPEAKPVAVLPHDFDGIQEQDHDTPWWFHGLFACTVIFSVSYFLHYHMGPGGDGPARLAQEDAALAELRLKHASGPLSEAQFRSLLSSTERIAKGKAAFDQAGCATCHGPDGTGGAGPDLFDAHWMWGNTMVAIHDSIAQGRNGGKMPPQSSKLGEEDINNVVTWIVDGNRKGGKPGKAPGPDEKRTPIDY